MFTPHNRSGVATFNDLAIELPYAGLFTFKLTVEASEGTGLIGRSTLHEIRVAPGSFSMLTLANTPSFETLNDGSNLAKQV